MTHRPSRNRGFAEEIVLLTLIVVLVAVYLGLRDDYHAKKEAQALVQLEGPGQRETSVYAALADKARNETLPRSPVGLWRHAYSEKDLTAALTLYLGEQGRLTLDLVITDQRGEERLRGLVNGVFEAHGRILQVSSPNGDTGLLPESGRLVVTELTPDRLTLLDSNAPDVMIFERLDLDEQTP